MTEPPEIYACLYAKEFPAQALLRLRPELRNTPCVVMDGEPPLEEVCSLTRKARTIVVKPPRILEDAPLPEISLAFRCCLGGYSSAVRAKRNTSS